VWRAGASKNELVRSLLGNDGEKEWHGANRAPTLLEAAAIEVPEPPSERSSGDLGAVLATAIQPHMSTKVDKQEVIDLIETHGSGMDVDTLTELCVSIIKDHTAPTELVIQDIKSDVITTLSRQHYKFELLLKLVQARIPAMLVGPAGTSKTTTTEAVAKATKLSYEGVTFSPMTTKADLFGYKDANGIYHDTALVRQATEGGVFLGDEIDSANAGVLTGVNMALANGHIAIPTGMKEKSEDFVFIGCANTFGTGANRQYVGRNQLDAATLDRFAFIEWDQDNGLEAHIVGINRPSPKLDITEGGVPTVEAWLDYVQRVRKKVDSLGLRMVVSTRATIYGAKLIKLGVGNKHLTEMLIYKGCDEATREKIDILPPVTEVTHEG
jgi:MoxR-like ATPase